MNNADFQLRGGADPRLAVHAASHLPAWLWSTDGTRILWANPVGARVFGAADAAAFGAKTFGAADQHRRQVAQLAGRLLPTGATRLERLRGFGATLGTLATCACSRLDFADGGAGVLVVAMLGPGELQRLSAPQRIAPAHREERPSLEQLARATHSIAPEQPTAAVEATGHLVVEPLPESPVHAEIEPTHQPDAAAMDRSTPDYEQAATTGEAPAEFSLIDEIADLPAAAAIEHGVADATTTPAEIHDQEPSPFIEAVADEPSQSSDSEPPPALASPPPVEPPPADELPPPLQTIEPRTRPIPVPPWLDEPPRARRHPLRFMWQMDAEGRFLLGSDEFTRLIGARTAASLGRLWSEIAEVFGLDPEGRVARAVATRDTWSGIALDWPVDGGARLRVELSGLPMFDRARNFAGYRGFGVCRDLEGLARLDALRRTEFFSDPAPLPLPLSADVALAEPAKDSPAANIAAEPGLPSSVPELPASIAVETSHQTDLETAVETPKNVLPFRPVNEPKSPSLTPVESNAFNELARQLSARLENETGAIPEAPGASDAPEAALEVPAAEASEPAGDRPDWLSHPEPPPRGEAARDKTLLDLLPTGVLIYRLDRLLYANPAFLGRVGYDSLQALEEAGGLDALLVEPGVSSASSTSDTGTPVTISATQSSPERAPPSATDAHLHAIVWDGDSAHALICLAPRAEPEAVSAIPAPEPSQVGHANAEELGAILDTTAEGIVMFDAQGNLNSCNRSAEALFGYDGDDLVRRNL
ncbi:MAG TPA: PAS domain-containing protein, partial [Bradyrhizobium sp.]|nr:PAS domain-containing protein [Bradyrhizobium sp.]